MARTSIATANFNDAVLDVTKWLNVESTNSNITNYTTTKFATANGPHATAKWIGAGTITADQATEILIHSEEGARSGAFIGVGGRCTGTSITDATLYEGRVDWTNGSGVANDVSICRVVNSVLTTLATTGSPVIFTAGTDKLSIEITGTGATVTIKAFKNTTLLLTYNDTSGSRITSAGTWAITGEGQNWVYGDDFVGSNVTADALSLAVDKGDLVFTGKSIGLQTSLAITKADLVFTGQAVTLTQSTSGTIVVTKGDLVFTGQSVAMAVKMPITKADAVFTGEALPFQLAVPWTEGQLVFTGKPVTLNWRTSLPVTKGDLVLTGSDVQLLANQSFTLPVTKGDLLFTGSSISLVANQSYILAVTKADLVFTPKVIGLPNTLVVISGSLLFTGQEIGLIYPINTGGAGGRIRKGRNRGLNGLLNIGR